MTSPLPLHRPVLGAEELDALRCVLDSGYLVQGPRVAAFEALLAERLGVEHVVAVSSGTAALHLALATMGASEGDEVIVPAFGFPATANSVELTGARAVAADVDPETMALTPETVAAVAGPRTVGVMPVHPFGIPAPMADLAAQATERGWWLVEDAACALGTAQDGRWATGEHPICISFHPRKTITTGEGGVVATRDGDLAARLRELRNHGISADADRGWRRFVVAGFNYRLTDLAAAIGCVQLGRLDAIVAGRQHVLELYRPGLEANPGLRLPRGYDLPGLSVQSLVVEIAASEQLGGLQRDGLIAALSERGIQTTIGGYAMAEQPYYQDRYGLRPEDTPVAWRLGQQALTLPVSMDMTEADVARVTGALGELMAGAGGAD